MNKKFTLLFLLILFIVVISIYFSLYRKNNKSFLLPPKNIRSFKECVDAGYRVGESYPRQCFTPDGRNFTEEIK
jgi:hypothetical protein